MSSRSRLAAVGQPDRARPVRSRRRCGYRRRGDHGADERSSTPAGDRCTTPDGAGHRRLRLRGPGTGPAAGPRHRLLRRGPSGHWPGRSAGTFHCWGLDLRGHGRSDRPADGDFAWSGFATDVLTVDRPPGTRPTPRLRPLVRGRRRPAGRAGPARARSGPSTASSRWSCPSRRGPDRRAQPAVRRGPPAAGDLPLGRGRPRQLLLQAALRRPRPRGTRLYVESGFELDPSRRGRGRPGRPAAVPPGGRGRDLRPGASHDAFAHLPEVACPVTLCCGEDTDAFGLPPHAGRCRPSCPVDRSRCVPGMGHFGPLAAARPGGRRRSTRP